MRLAVLDLSPHALRIAASALLLAIAPPVLAPLAAVALFFSLFHVAHDLVHGALGLPRRLGDVAITAIGLAILTSGHSMRRMHLHHHARPMADDDLEGSTAAMSLWGSLVASPRVFLALRVEGYRRAGRRERRWQIAEHLACAAAIAAAFATSPAAVTYVAVTLLAQLTSPVWAGHVVHRLPPWVLRALSALAFTGSPLILSLAYHELHHARPKVPCQQLGRACRAAS